MSKWIRIIADIPGRLDSEAVYHLIPNGSIIEVPDDFDTSKYIPWEGIDRPCADGDFEVIDELEAYTYQIINKNGTAK